VAAVVAARLKAVLAGLAVLVVVVLAAVRSQEPQAPRIRVAVLVVGTSLVLAAVPVSLS
jgi:hypothetical protein